MYCCILLQQIGEKRFVFAHRDTEGYGLNMAAVERFHQDGVQLIMTVDCGFHRGEGCAWM